MIKLLGFKKTYFNKKILEFPRLEFDKTGFYLVYGRSGCGKTTLLNCLSLLEDFEGDYLIQNKKLNNLSDDEKAQIRANQISYVHQKPVLLNDFSVFDNIKLFTNLKKGEILNYLAKFNLIDKKDQPIKLLSGGEKSRVALIKCLVLEKPIILADEPTGALDKKNAVFVVEKLKELSKNHLVIVVSHDVSLFKPYSDCIIKVKNETIEIEREKIKKYDKPKRLHKNTFFKTSFVEKKYNKHIVKKRKIKNMLVSLFTSLSLICVSLTLLISFNVRQELVNGFSQFYEPNQLVIKNRASNIGQFKAHSPSNEEIKFIKEKLEVEPRVCYKNNFEMFFKDGNSLHLVLKYRTVQIEGFSARHFNEFKPIEGVDTKYLIKNDLELDEIVLSIDNQMMLELCYQFSIQKTFSSLFNHLKNNEVYVSLFVKNFDWEYEDEQLFRLVGFAVEPGKFIYHSNLNFSYDLFENRMRLPSTVYDEVQDKPWYLKKDYIVEINNNQAMNQFYYDERLSNFYLEKTNHNDLSTWYEKTNIVGDNLYKIFKKSSEDLIPSSKIKWLKDNEYDFNLTNNFYVKNSLVSGFVNEIFISPDVSSIDYVEDNYFKSDLNGQIKVDDNLNVCCGGFLVESKNVFKLGILGGGSLTEEVAISRKLYDKFSKSLQNSTIFLIGLTNRYNSNGKIIKEYVKTEIKFDKVIEDNDEYVIYGNEFFINNFFRDYLGYNYEKYAGSAVNLTINDTEKEQIIRQYFYNYNVSKPFEEINSQLDGIINILMIILSIFSLIIIAVSIFLLSLIIKSFILDFKEDLHVLYCNGFSKNSIVKILKKYIQNTFIKSTVVTIIFNLGMSVLISFIVSKSLNIAFKFSLSYLSIIASIILSIIMIFIGFTFVNKFVKKENIVISIRN